MVLSDLICFLVELRTSFRLSSVELIHRFSLSMYCWKECFETLWWLLCGDFLICSVSSSEITIAEPTCVSIDPCPRWYVPLTYVFTAFDKWFSVWVGLGKLHVIDRMKSLGPLDIRRTDDDGDDGIPDLRCDTDWSRGGSPAFISPDLTLPSSANTPGLASDRSSKVSQHVELPAPVSRAGPISSIDCLSRDTSIEPATANGEPSLASLIAAEWWGSAGSSVTPSGIDWLCWGSLDASVVTCVVQAEMHPVCSVVPGSKTVDPACSCTAGVSTSPGSVVVTVPTVSVPSSRWVTLRWLNSSPVMESVRGCFEGAAAIRVEKLGSGIRITSPDLRAGILECVMRRIWSLCGTDSSRSWRWRER